LSPELYGYGGEQFGRGYDASELTGDHGAALKFEVRYKLPRSLTELSTLYGFYDVGTVRQRSPGGLQAAQSAASAGAGLRFNFGRYLSGFFEFAKPLTRPRAEDGQNDTQGYAGLSLRF
jgi:hemolysin activation/secretion protein